MSVMINENLVDNEVGFECFYHKGGEIVIFITPAPKLRHFGLPREREVVLSDGGSGKIVHRAFGEQNTFLLPTVFLATRVQEESRTEHESSNLSRNLVPIENL